MWPDHGMALERACPAWFQASYERVLASGLSLEVTQGDHDEMRADRELEMVRLASPEYARRLLEGDD